MTRRLVNTSRRAGPGLLSRPPCGTFRGDERWTASLIDRVRQFDALVELVDRGLLSPDEFERWRRTLLLDVATPAARTVTEP